MDYENDKEDILPSHAISNVISCEKGKSTLTQLQNQKQESVLSNNE